MVDLSRLAKQVLPHLLGSAQRDACDTAPYWDEIAAECRLLLAFGDKVLIKPGPLPLRRQLLETSVKRHWLPVTTEAKVMMDLELDVRDPYMLSIFRSF